MRDILQNREANEEGGDGTEEPLLGKRVKISKDPEDEDSYDEFDEKEISRNLGRKEDQDNSAVSYAQGHKQLKQFLRCFREMPRLKRNGIADHKYNAYLSECGRQGIAPRMLGVVNRRGSRGSLEADSRFMGDNYGRALGAAISKSRLLQRMVLSRNALTDKGAATILKSLRAEHQLLELDLSFNPGLGRETYERLAGYL